MSNEERDINDIFDEIVFTEENLSKKSYEEGLSDGIKEGNFEGYQLGYIKGIELGEELGKIYGAVIAYMQLENSERTKKSLEIIKSLIDDFPKTNEEDVDIIAKIEEIRSQFKKVKSILKISDTQEKVKDLSF